MKIYLLLCRLGWPRSYVGKFLLISFLGVHVPLIGAVLYLLAMADLTSNLAVGVLVTLVVATVVGSAITMASLYALLSPIREAAKAIKGYLRERRVPQLPTQIDDDAGVLMANIQEGIVRLDAALDAARSRLDATEQDSKGKFGMLSAMSHELRTPLNHIIGFAEMMATEALGPLGQPHYRGYASNISESGGQLLKAVQTVLELSEASAGPVATEPQAVAVIECVESTLRLVHLNAQAQGISFTREVASDVSAIVDQRAFKQILLHSFQGAVDAAESGSTVQVVVRREFGMAVLELIQAGRPWYREDVPPELRDSMRDLTDAVNSGEIASASTQALRLSLIRTLVMANRGALTLHNSREGGRILRLRLPIECPARAVARKNEARAAA
jgi:signal transduction histidine kinase